MQIIVNATFLINIIKTDVRVLKMMNFATLTSIAMEVENELGIKLDELKVEILKSEKSSPHIPENKYKSLSDVDINLINLSFKRRDSCTLITDDRLLRWVAKENKIKCFTTPQFMAFLLKNGKISKARCKSFLNLLKETYIRKKDIEKVLDRIERW